MRIPLVSLVAILVFVAVVPQVSAQSDETDGFVVGLMLSAGGRYDNVRMCVGSPPGVPGGPAMDISFFTEWDVTDDATINVNIPVMRPILFGLSFQMLQFEPDVALLFRKHSEGDTVELVGGPTLGLSLHYGPDYESDSDGPERGPSFFALGPRIGGYIGLDFPRPGETFNFQLGLAPYFTPLFSVNDPARHRGIVVGGALEGLFRFHVGD